VGTLDLGCVTNCQDLVIDYLAPAMADYTLVVAFGGQLTEITSTIDIGLPLSFDLTGLNESYVYTGYVRDAAGDTLIFNDPVSGDSYDCFQFKTKLGLTINQPSISLNLVP
jgi:hypothetical protein